MAWVGSYQETCRDLGIDDAELDFPAGPGRGIAALVDCYTSRVHGLLNTWFTNILEVCRLGETFDTCLHSVCSGR